MVWTFTQGHLNTEQDTVKINAPFDISSFKHWRMAADVLILIFVDYEEKKTFFQRWKLIKTILMSSAICHETQGTEV